MGLNKGQVIVYTLQVAILEFVSKILVFTDNTILGCSFTFIFSNLLTIQHHLDHLSPSFLNFHIIPRNAR